MKRVIWAVLVLFVGVAVYAADPANNSVYNAVGSVTVDSGYSATVTEWNVVDSIIVLETDTCDVYFTVTGSVTLTSLGQRFYVAFQDSPDGEIANMKTYQLPPKAKGPMTINFGNFYVDSLRSQTDKTDSIYVWFCAGGSGMGEKVYTTSVVTVGTVINKD